MSDRPLGDVLTLDLDPVALEDERIYPTVGIYSFGRGLFERPLVTGKDTSYSTYYRLQRGQFVYSKLFAWEGALAVVDERSAGMFVSQEFPTFTIDPALALPDYVSLLCSWPETWTRVRMGETGLGGRRKRVHPDRLLEVELPFPSLAAQRRIVDLIATIDNSAHRSRVVSTTAWNVVGAMLKDHEQAVTGDSVMLQDLLASTIGGVWGSEPGIDEIDVRVVRSTEFSNDGSLMAERGVIRSVTARQLVSRRLVSNDILLEKSGGGPKQPVGRVVFVENPVDPTVCANFVQLVRPDPTRVNPRYLFFRMWNWHSTGRTLEYQSQTTGIRNLRTKDYLAQSLVLPNIDAQNTFVSLLLTVVEEAHAASALADASSRVRSSLLTDLLSGGHKVPDIYDALLETT